MYIKKGRLTKLGMVGCADITERYSFSGEYEMAERNSINYIKCLSKVVIKHDDIDGEIHLQKGTYKYCL